jgi:hypothetical protein|tara:strand:- start:107 stop:331 length:225 start_codon:yes stop_codon:yes gene_type:complete
MLLIRKISIGPDLLKAMNFSIGQPMLRGKHTVTEIIQLESGHIQIWLTNSDDEVYLWKTIGSNMPVSIEYNIEY